MSLPCAECKGQCCTYPAMSRREFKTIRKKYGVPKLVRRDEYKFLEVEIIDYGHTVVPISKEDGKCAYLNTHGACTVYDLRPSTCRKYGEIPELPCQYLYPDKAKKMALELMQKAERLI